MDEPSRGRISRWSKKKIESRQAETAEEPIIDGAKTDSSTKENSSTAQLSDIPSLDNLNSDSDFTRFLQSDVPASIKKAALRKLWLSDPVLANVDGLNDYDENFATMGLGKLVKTAYQVGAGMVEQIEKSESTAVETSAQQAEKSSPDLNPQEDIISDNPNSSQGRGTDSPKNSES